MKTIYRVEHAESSFGFDVQLLGIYEDLDKAREFRDKYVTEYLEEINEYEPKMVPDFYDKSYGGKLHEDVWILTEAQKNGDEVVTNGDRDYISLIQDELK